MLDKTLYKLDTKDKIREWTINVENKGTTSEIVIKAGIHGGKLVTNSIVITEGKNLGKSNATTHYTQAVAEALAKFELQERSGYVQDINAVQKAVLRSGISAPMLAQKYHPTGAQNGSKTLDKMKIRGHKIHVQPKYDGNRCLIRVDENGGIAYTRKGDAMPVQLGHIVRRVVAVYNEIYKDEKPVITLDGELFSNEMSFNELNGHLKRKDSQDAEALSKIKYHLYDIMEETFYDQRYELIRPFADGVSVLLVPSYEIVATDENIKEKLEEFLAEGHEGLMIRTLDKGYENKRSWQLVKVKLFEDSEFEVEDLELDVMGRLGKFIMKLPKPVVDRDGKTVTTFKAGVTGITHEEGLEIIKRKNDYIGKMATVEFFGWDVRPRFPKFKGLRQN